MYNQIIPLIIILSILEIKKLIFQKTYIKLLFTSPHAYVNINYIT